MIRRCRSITEKDPCRALRYHANMRRLIIPFCQDRTAYRPGLFETIDAVLENCAACVWQTGVLNEILAEAVAMQQPPSDKGKRLRIYYITQV